MDLVIKGLLAGLWLIIVPTAVGSLFLKKVPSYTLGECFLTGYLFLFTAAEILILAATYRQVSLHQLVRWYGVIGTVAAIAGMLRLKSQAGRIASEAKANLRGASPYFWCAAILIFMQLCIVVFYAHFDADDAFYVGTATTAVQTDSVFAVNPYTGMAYSTLPKRYVLSPFPIYLAIISQLCNGLHPAITAHVIFPPVFLVMSYLVCYLIGRRWFQGDHMGRGIFLFLIAALNCFTTYSVYNAGRFQMIRIWQGKSLLAAALLPLLFYLSLSIMMEEKPRYPWLLLFFANGACCLLSSMGIMLAPLLQGIFLLFSLLKFGSLRRLLAGLLCCVPSLILGLVYLLVL